MVIHCIGDSHVTIFGGQDIVVPQYPEPSIDLLPQFKTYRLGACLAYNLPEEGHTSQGREKLFTVLKTIAPMSTVMLVFGEIDVRTQLIKQAKQQKQSIQKIVNRCVERYFTVIMEVSQEYQVLVWATPPQGMELHSSNKFPTVGTGQERNKVARLFNAALQRRCEEYLVPYVNIFDKVVNVDNETDMSYFFDTAHLSQKALPFALEALQEWL